MAQELFLSLLIQCTSTKKPIYEVTVDGVSAHANSISQVDQFRERHNFVLHLPKVHTIDISLLNKGAYDTVLDAFGKIEQDLLIIVEKVLIDKIDLSDKLSSLSNYRGENGKVYRTHNYITFNGVYRIKVHKNPLYADWLSSFF